MNAKSTSTRNMALREGRFCLALLDLSREQLFCAVQNLTSFAFVTRTSPRPSRRNGQSRTSSVASPSLTSSVVKVDQIDTTLSPQTIVAGLGVARVSVSF